jgi:type IV secretory pathway TrbD component
VSRYAFALFAWLAMYSGLIVWMVAEKIKELFK